MIVYISFEWVVLSRVSVGEGAVLHYSPYLTNSPSIDEPLPIDFKLFPHCMYCHLPLSLASIYKIEILGVQLDSVLTFYEKPFALVSLSTHEILRVSNKSAFDGQRIFVSSRPSTQPIQIMF